MKRQEITWRDMLDHHRQHAGQLVEPESMRNWLALVERFCQEAGPAGFAAMTIEDLYKLRVWLKFSLPHTRRRHVTARNVGAPRDTPLTAYLIAQGKLIEAAMLKKNPAPKKDVQPENDGKNADKPKRKPGPGRKRAYDNQKMKRVEAAISSNSGSLKDAAILLKMPYHTVRNIHDAARKRKGRRP
jgi:hypothetical protein